MITTEEKNQLWSGCSVCLPEFWKFTINNNNKLCLKNAANVLHPSLERVGWQMIADHII